VGEQIRLAEVALALCLFTDVLCRTIFELFLSYTAIFDGFDKAKISE
jgi:hypothetical protein